MKKLLVSVLALTGVVALVGCGEETSTDNVVLDDVIAKVLFAQSAGLDELRDDLSLTTNVKHEDEDYAVSWESGNEDLIKISEDNSEALVTRPESGTGDMSTTITASVTDGDETAEKDFDVTVIAESASRVNLEDLSGLASDTEVLVEGTIFGTIENGFFIADSTGTGFVYDWNWTDYNVSIGDLVQVTGEKGAYYNSPQIGSPSKVEVVTGTKTDVSAIDFDFNVAVDQRNNFFNQLVIAEGTLVNCVVGGEDGTDPQYGFVCIEDANGNVMRVSENGDVSELAAFVGKNVKLTALITTYHTGDEAWYATFIGGSDNIESTDLSDNEVEALIVAELAKVTGTYNEAFELETTLFDTAINYTVANNDVLTIDSNTGEVTITYPSAEVTVDITAGFKVGSNTATTETIAITVLPLVDGNNVDFDFDFKNSTTADFDSHFNIVDKVYTETGQNFYGVKMGTGSANGEFVSKNAYNNFDTIEISAIAWTGEDSELTITCSNGATGSKVIDADANAAGNNDNDIDGTSGADYTITLDKECVGSMTVLTSDDVMNADGIDVHERVIIWGMKLSMSTSVQG